MSVNNLSSAAVADAQFRTVFAVEKLGRLDSAGGEKVAFSRLSRLQYVTDGQENRQTEWRRITLACRPTLRSLKPKPYTVLV